MNYEEKYKAGVEAIQDVLDSGSDSIKLSRLKLRLQSVFPELKESEDEKIAKELIRYLPYCDDIAKDTKEKWIAWLEKQCEKSLFNWHNINDEPEEMRELLCEWESSDATWHDVAFYHSDRTFWNGTQQVENVVKWCYIDDLLEKQDSQKTNNAEPKFKVKDWVIGRATENEPRQIAEVTKDGYKTTYGGWIGLSFEEDMHLWTIEDAKGGDVLVNSSGKPFIFKQLVNQINGKFPQAYGGIDCTDKFFACDSKIMTSAPWTIDLPCHPATKEQRDLLFIKMKQERYCNPSSDLIEKYEAFVKRYHYLG